MLCRKQSEEVFAEFHLYLAGDEAGARGVFVGGDEQHVVLEGDEITVESANDRAVAFGQADEGLARALEEHFVAANGGVAVDVGGKGFFHDGPRSHVFPTEGAGLHDGGEPVVEHDVVETAMLGCGIALRQE